MKRKSLPSIYSISMIFFVAFPGAAQNPASYEDLWKNVLEYENKAKPRSAIAEVEKIYQLSIAEGNNPQKTKAIIYKLKLMESFQEDAIIKGLQYLDTELDIADSPVKEILLSLKGEMLWSYYQNERYNIMERGEINSKRDDDITTWSYSDFAEVVNTCYLNSVNDITKTISIKSWAPILLKGKDQNLRPTLYDFLAFRALNHFSDKEAFLNRSVHEFSVNNEKFLSKYSMFIAMDLSDEQKNASWYYLNIMQDLLRFHSGDKELSAFIDADLIRLKYVYDNSSFESRDEVYLSRLLEWFKGKDMPVIVAEAGVMAANMMYHSSNKDICNLCEAKILCESVIEKYPKTETGKLAIDLLQSILSKSIGIQIPEVTPLNTHELAMVTVRNVDRVFLRVVKLDFDLHPAMSSRKQNLKKPDIYFSKEIVAEWSYSYDLPKDYEEHSFEIALPKLTYGYYAVLVSPKESFSNDGMLSYAEFQVSDMSLISLSESQENNIIVNERLSGTPIENVEVSVYSNDYRHGTTLIDEGTTDDVGVFKTKAGKNRYSEYVVLNKGKDRLVSGVYLFNADYRDMKNQMRSWIFTDRAVYRPGQTVYFKALLTTHKNEDVALAANTKIVLELKDLNYQVRDEKTLITNDYGTVNGVFVIPSDIPTGHIVINTPYGRKNIRVEEYKRPSFEINVHENKNRKNESDPFIVSGKVETYSGLPVDNAEVKYHVTRSLYLPWRWWWRPFNYDKKEIAFGTVETDKEGVFSVNFEAAQKYHDKDFFGYTYLVTFTVTDIVGETHEISTSLIDAVKKIAVKTDLPEVSFADEQEKVSVEIINHNNEIEKCAGSVVIEKLLLPKKVYRSRLWDESTDITIFSEEEFMKKFPLDYYKKPLPDSELQADKKVLSREFVNGKTILHSDEWKGWKSGVYRMSVEAVSGKDTASTIKEFVIINGNNDKPAQQSIFKYYYKNNEYEPGETASMIISSVRNIYGHYILSDGKKILDRKVILLNNSIEEIRIPVKEEYRGNIFVTLFANIEGRFYGHSQKLNVPYTNKVLDVEFLTFRDVTEPGSEEKWTLKVTDYQGNPVQGEMIASLYDRSLDAIEPMDYSFSPFKYRYNNVSVDNYLFGIEYHRYYNRYNNIGYMVNVRDYDRLIWKPFNMFSQQIYSRSGGVVNMKSMNLKESMAVDDALFDEQEHVMPVATEENRLMLEAPPKKAPELRSDFRETGFFYPELKTNEEGIVEISFTSPQSVTGWKLLGLVHTKDVKNAIFENEMVTRKEVMITPNMPRFVRQGDQLILQARINNMQEQEVNVETRLELFDPETDESMETLISGFNRKVKSVDAGGSAMAEWKINIPYNISALGVRTYAQSDLHTDGEEHVIPVLASQTLVIESMPMSIDGKGKYDFTFEKLKEKGGATNNFALTLEYTANPAWYAVQALPSLEESQSKNAAAIFNSYYANALASHIANYNPAIKRIFHMWREQSPQALFSALEKNPELKTTLLQESPWLADAKSETEQKHRIALLFDINRIGRMKAKNWSMLSQMQYPDGSWPWFEGMKPSLFTTLSVVENSARLYYLGVENNLPAEIIKAARYLDKEAEKQYLEAKREKGFNPDECHISNFAISWMYARSLLGDNVDNAIQDEWYEFYMQQIKDHWTSFGLYQQSLASIILYFNVEPVLAEEIIASLKERAMYSDKLGMYWRSLHSSPYWYSAPISTMASLIEAFTLIADDEASVRQMKKWLLTQKQTNKWSSSIGTVHAIYALLLQGDEMLAGSNDLTISLGGNEVVSKDETKEPGTGYIKKIWHDHEVTSNMGEVQVTTDADRFSWGALHWQYYSTYGEIESAGNGLTILRKLYKKVLTEKGPVLKEISDQKDVKTGDKIVVRMMVTADRDFSFVHLKDQRTAAFEPTESRSGYRYKDGAGYYLSIRDASVNYFFDRLTKGNYLFEYELFRVRTGTYTGGLSTIQCVYAPEFNAHSQGQ